MSDLKTRMLLFGVVGGVVITLLTGLLSNTPSMLVGAEYYGYPMPWLIRLVIAPEYFPWKADYVNLIVDVVVWFVIVAVVLSLLMMRKKK